MSAPRVRRKLIEVALPLDAINAAAAREKSIRHWNPSTCTCESNGTFSAWVAGLPGVYAAADTATAAKRGIRSALAALDALTALGQDVKPQADLLVLRHDPRAPTRRERLRFVGPGALMGQKTTAAKAEAARRNGRKGGRPAERARLAPQARSCPSTTR